MTLSAHERGHTELGYGTFSRVVRLPEGADTGHCKAIYEAGILEVRFPVHEKTQARQIPVTMAK